jgi:molecular chaperone GrpE
MTDSVSKPEAVGPSNGLSDEDEILADELPDEDEIVADELPDEDEANAPSKDRGSGAEESVEGSVGVTTDGEGHPEEIEVGQLREELRGLNDRHLRLAAEFNNYRRRLEAERLELWARAQADLVGRFLDVLDDLQRVAGLDLDNATVEAIMEGIDLVDRKFMRVLQDAGAEVIDPAGEPFDPEIMEAMMRVPTEEEDQDDIVDQVFLKGYGLKGQLIRPARVSVRKYG